MAAPKDDNQRQNQVAREQMEAEYARQQALKNKPEEPKPESTEEAGEDVKETVKDEAAPKEEPEETPEEGKTDYVGSQMEVINRNKKIIDDNIALEKAEAEEKKQQEQARAAAEEQKKKEEEEQLFREMYEEEQAKKEETIAYNEASAHQMEEQREAEVEKHTPKDEESLGKKSSKRAKDILDKTPLPTFEESRTEHMALRGEYDEEGKLVKKTKAFAAHEEKQEKVVKQMEDIFKNQKEGESPLEAMRRRKQEKEAQQKMKQTVDAPPLDAAGRAEVDRREQHLNVTPELKRQSFLNDDRKAELDEAGGAPANQHYTQTQKTVRQIDTPEEIQESKGKKRKLDDTSESQQPAKKLAATPQFKGYAKQQEEKQQQKTSTPTPKPGHDTAPRPDKKT